MGKIIQFDSTLKDFNDHFHEYIRVNKSFILETIEGCQSQDEMRDCLYVISQRIIGKLILNDYERMEDHELLLKGIIDGIGDGSICQIAFYFRDLVLNTPSIKKVIDERFGR